MDNPELTFQILEVFSKVKSKEIPRELEEYISYVARTGDPVFQWSMVKVLIKEKLLAVLNEFMEGGGPVDIPPCPNVDMFNYETMKEHLLAQIDSFMYPPFTIQRICELLATPRKEYNRIDKYMRAIEKNVLVVSASELSLKRGLEADSSDSVMNGILYDKENESLNSFTNHVFAASDEAEDELSANSKLDETDAVQQIIDESWNEETNDEFKLNGGNGGVTIPNANNVVSFDHELQQFVTAAAASNVDDHCDRNVVVDDDDDDEEDDDDDDTTNSSNTEATEQQPESSTTSTFEAATNATTTLMQPILQTIIAESTNISFENVSKSDDSFDDTTSCSRNDDTYEFKDSSLEVSDVNTSSTSDNSVLLHSSPTGLPAIVDSTINSNDDEIINQPVNSTIIDVAEKVEKQEKQEEFIDSTTTSTITTTMTTITTPNVDETSSSMDVTATSMREETTVIDDPMIGFVDEESKSIESNFVEAMPAVADDDDSLLPTIAPTTTDNVDSSDSICAKESEDENTFGAGDNRECDEKNMKEVEPQSTVVETNVETETSSLELTSHDGE